MIPASVVTGVAEKNPTVHFPPHVCCYAPVNKESMAHDFCGKIGGGMVKRALLTCELLYTIGVNHTPFCDCELLHCAEVLPTLASDSPSSLFPPHHPCYPPVIHQLHKYRILF